MKSSFVLGAAILGVALSGWAQQIKQAKPPKARHTSEFRVNEGATGSKTAGAPVSPTRSANSSSNASGKQLRQIEAEHVRKTSHTTRKLPATGLNEKQRNSAKINFTGNPKARAGWLEKEPVRGGRRAEGHR